jgi:ABC-type molybdate transport system substrate-binding protein
LVLVGNEHCRPARHRHHTADFAKLIAGKRLAIANPERDVGPAPTRSSCCARSESSSATTITSASPSAESSAGVSAALATNKARLGIVYATDATAGFKLTCPLPALDEPPIEYIVARGPRPEADTQPFMAFLKSPEAKRRSNRRDCPLDD